MTDIIRLKRSGVSGAAPASLELGELAINYADGVIYYKTGAGAIAAFGSGDSLLRSLFSPGAPTGVTATGGNAQAVVSWTAPSGTISQAPVTDYVVQYQPSGGSWTTFSDGTSTSTSVTVTGLVNGTAYAFRVAAVNAVGQGAWSAASDSVTPALPAADQYASSTDVLLRMNDTTTDEFGATVTVSGTPSYSTGRFGKGMTAATFSVPTSSYGSSAFVLEGWFKVPSGALLAPDNYNMYTAYQSILFGLGNGLEPTYQDGGAAFRGIQVQRISSGFSGTPLAIVYKGEGGLGGYGTVGPSNGITIDDNQWHHIAMVRSANDAIRLYIDGSLAASSTLNANVGSLAASPQVFLTKNSAVYYDELRLTVGTDRGFTGSTITVPTEAFPAPLEIAPGSPTSLTATAGDGSVSLSWTAPARNGSLRPTDYIIESSTNGSSWSTVSDGTSSATTATVSGLTNGVQYTFRVSAVNPYGTSSPSSTATATPAQAATLTITTQPKNDYSVSSSDTATFSVAASLGSGTISYQWQAYGYDGNYELNWQNIPGKTSSTMTLTPSTWGSTGIGIDYINDVRVRCVVTGSGGAGSLTSSEARWVLFSNINRYADIYGGNGTYPNGSQTVGGQSYQTLSLSSGESLEVFANDYYSGLDTSWYSSNAYTAKLQVSTDASSWSDVHSVNLRSTVEITHSVAAQTGTKYYRVLLIGNWPFTTTNSSQSSSRSAPEIFMSGAIVTWS